MKKLIGLLVVLLPLISMAQQDTIPPGVYNWKQPDKKSKEGKYEVLFEGQAHNMKMLQVSSTAFQFTKKNRKYSITVSKETEEILIIKSGTMEISINGTSYAVGAGSIVFLEPDDKFICTLQNNIDTTCNFYTIRYMSKLPRDDRRGQQFGGSKVVNWDTVTFNPNANGGRRDFLNCSTALSNRVEIHTTTLKPGLRSHDPHTHLAPEFIIVTEGETEEQINTQFYQGRVGSIYFLPSNSLHAIRNVGKNNCTYFAVQLE